ncbi:TIGR01777 family oxidoreductase [bacterium]|nr:TIGR01777 family oxidoreductase [bacterium]
MKIIISGSSGLVGSALVFNLISDGHQVFRLVRSSKQDGIVWDPKQPFADRSVLEGFDAVIHLAGESIAEGRWNEEKKRAIRESRVLGTRHLSDAIASLNSPPKVFVCASASGYYGDRGDEILREESPPGTGFLPDVCKEWEAATQSAADKGIRVVNTRFGIILSQKGGALPKMITPFKLGAGGRIGSGKQYWSWIDLDDVVGVIEHCVNNDALEGPVNTSTPNPVTNAVFTQTLARVLKRPAIFPVPAFAARAAFGEMADALLFCSFRMQPAKLIASGYTFAYPDLESSLLHLLI